jgi:hypothetical protein
MGRKIVIVDDDQDLVLGLTARLKAPAKTGETAGRTARNPPPQHFLCACLLWSISLQAEEL